MAWGRGDHGDGWVEREEGVQLPAPLLAVQLVDEEVEGPLLGEGPRGVDGDEVHAAPRRARHQRRLDEALLLLRRQGVADEVAPPLPVAGHRFG